MKNIFVKFLPLGIISLLLFSAGSGQTKKTEAKTIKPTAKESLKVLFKNGDIQMASIRSCISMKTKETDKTIFDYLSAILANQAEPKTKNSLGFNVKSVKGRRNRRLWQVDLTFNNLDEESGDPWNQGFRFLMRMQDNQMIRGSFQCLGN